MNTRLFFNSESIDIDDGYFLRLALSNSGYLDLLSAVPPAADVIGTISSIYEELQEPLKSICDLLLFGKTVCMEKLPEALVESILKIRESGLIALRGNAVSLNNLYLQLVDGLLYFSELPHGRQTLYYGTDLTHWPVVWGPPLLGIMFSTTVPVQEFKDCYLHRMAHT